MEPTYSCKNTCSSYIDRDYSYNASKAGHAAATATTAAALLQFESSRETP